MKTRINTRMKTIFKSKIIYYLFNLSTIIFTPAWCSNQIDDEYELIKHANHYYSEVKGYNKSIEMDFKNLASLKPDVAIISLLIIKNPNFIDHKDFCIELREHLGESFYEDYKWLKSNIHSHEYFLKAMNLCYKFAFEFKHPEVLYLEGIKLIKEKNKKYSKIGISFIEEAKERGYGKAILYMHDLNKKKEAEILPTKSYQPEINMVVLKGAIFASFVTSITYYIFLKLDGNK